MKFYIYVLVIMYRMIQKDGLSLTVNGASTHAQTVGCGIPSSLLALPVDLRGLRSKLS
jgi:hypothetical protein